MTDLPPGYVDPQDVGLVTQVLRAVLDAAGPTAVLDLLAGLPGVRVDPGARKGFLRAAVPPSTWVGPENQLVLVGDASGERLEHHHVVGGITLARDTLARDRIAPVVARLVSGVVAAGGGATEASAVLSAHRELYGPA